MFFFPDAPRLVAVALRLLPLLGAGFGVGVGVGLASCSMPSQSLPDGGDPSVVSEACRERVSASLEAIEAVRLQHLACEQATDCTLFDPTTQCLGGCPLPIAASGLDAVRATIDSVNGGTCRSFTEDGCPYATPGCIQGFAACVDKQCAATMTPVGE